MIPYSLILRRSLLISMAMIVLGVYSLQANPPPFLFPPAVLPGQSVDLRLGGQTGSSYTIEVSDNLRDWIPVFTGIAGADGQVTTRHAAGPNRPTLFYRGREAVNTLPPLTVGPQVDTNFTVSTLLTSAGGSAVLYGFGGTRFTFSIPTNAVLEPTILKLTLVTNISGLPFGSGMRGAVRIEPDDLFFWAPGTLEITFSPEIDRRYLASFFCNADGSSFQLTSDRVQTDTIAITVMWPGIFGSSVITAQELADEARREIGESPMSAVNTAMHLHAAGAPECPLGSESLAADMRRRLIEARTEAIKSAVAKLVASRQVQPEGATADSAQAIMDYFSALCNFYENHIQRAWATAVVNCAVGNVVLAFALSANRDRELNGLPPCSEPSEMPSCLVYQNCLDEIRKCCQQATTKEAKMARAVLSLLRNQQLLGFNCIPQEKGEEVIELCSTNAWMGTFTVQGTGSTTNVVDSAGGTTTTTIDEYKYQFDGMVEESTEHGRLSTGLIIQLKVRGNLSYRNFRSTENARACSYSLSSSEVVAKGPTEYSILIGTTPDGLYTLSAFHNFTSRVSGTSTSILRGRSRICDPPEVVTHTIRREPAWVVGQGPYPYDGKMTGTNQIAGTVSLDLEGRPPTKFRFNWSFTRHETAQ
jgi:hypothetical protein